MTKSQERTIESIRSSQVRKDLEIQGENKCGEILIKYCSGKFIHLCRVGKRGCLYTFDFIDEISF
jgi:hypothetical protein